MVQWIAESLRPFVQQLAINCNNDQDNYLPFADLVCGDRLEGFRGPLCGLHSLLCASEADYLLTSSCDTPMLNASYGESMLAALQSDLVSGNPPALVYCARSNLRVHPTHLLIARQSIKSLEDAINKDQLRAMDWLSSQHPAYVDFSDQNIFVNCNRPEDLKSFESDRSHKSPD